MTEEQNQESQVLPGQAEMTGNLNASQSREHEEVHSRDLHDIVGLISQVVDKMAASTGSRPSGEASGGADQHLKIFQSFSPSVFKGTCEPIEAEDWLENVERILDGMVCPEDRKVLLATFVLEGEARRWWQAQHREKFNYVPLPQIYWDEFVEDFRERFIPPAARLELQDKFISLTQGTKTVLQYEAEFTALSRYAPHYIGTHEEKCHRFLKGLQSQMRLLLTSLAIKTFSDLVARACALESELNDSCGNLSFGNRQQQYQGQQYSGKKRSFGGDNLRSKQIKSEQKHKSEPYQERPVCEKCGKRHLRQCWLELGNCFRCGEM